MASIALIDVSKAYPTGQAAVRNLSLEIQRGELLVLAARSRMRRRADQGVRWRPSRLIDESKAYSSGHVAVRGLSLEIESGELLVLVARSRMCRPA